MSKYMQNLEIGDSSRAAAVPVAAQRERVSIDGARSPRHTADDNDASTKPLPLVPGPSAPHNASTSTPPIIREPVMTPPAQTIADPLQSRRSIDSARSDTSFSSITASLPPLQTPSNPQQSTEGEVTALSSVILPALEAALHRRSYQLSLLARSQQQSHPQPQSQSSRLGAGSNTTATANGDAAAGDATAAAQDLLLKRQAHEQIRKLVSKTCKIMREIDHWDNVASVGMGDGIQWFLEGVLEEVLCRVEPEDA